MPQYRNSKKLTFSLVKGGRGGAQGGSCTVRGPQGEYGGMDYPQSTYGSNQMQAQYGGGMGYNQAHLMTPSGGDQYGRGSMVQGSYTMGAGVGGDQQSIAASNQYPAEVIRNANCPISGCIRSKLSNGKENIGISGSFAQNGSVAGNGGYGNNFQVPCLECGGLPNPACLLPGQGNGSIAPGMPGGGVGMMTPCLECGGIPNPPCMGNGFSGGAGGVGLTPCQECGGLPNPPCGAGTCGGATPCTECAGNPNAPCLNMGPCDYCPEPPPVDDKADKEVFVLRIGKKREGTDKKPKMELELVTPKAPVVKPIPKLETRDTQYDSKDVNGKKGKGKGNKGKKKKK